ncbi:MAG: isoprenyl transferase [Candidatus Margulisiibacteriota bacterium]
MFKKLKKTKTSRDAKICVSALIDPKKIPQHIAIIMDGNGRWAQKRGLPRNYGHKKGVDTLRRIIKACQDLNVKYLSVYAFSTENWRRQKKEVDFLMELLQESIKKELAALSADNPVKVKFFGRITELTSSLQKMISKAEESTQAHSGLQLNIMLNYGSRAEIVDACKKILEDKIPSAQLNEEVFSRYLYTAELPAPDLLIRTSGEFRLSNFLLWQIAYSELWITPKLWPDLQKNDLIEAIADFQHRQRRFGAER